MPSHEPHVLSHTMWPWISWNRNSWQKMQLATGAVHNRAAAQVEVGRDIFETLLKARSSSRRYSPGMALASSTIRFHWSLFLSFSIHPLIPILLRSAITSSSHLILGLPILLVAYGFLSVLFLGMAVSSILSTWSSHCILCAFINLAISSPPISLHSSLSYLIRHTPLSTTGPYIFLSAFLSNLLNAFSSTA